MTTNDSEKSWNKLLNRNVLQTNLLLASLYLSAYEILKSAIIARIEEFYSRDYVNGRRIVSNEYQTDVKQLHSSLLRASCDWLKQNGAISQTDIDDLDSIRKHRNEIAHELPSFLSDIRHEIDINNFNKIRFLLNKIEMWWITEVELSLNSDFDSMDIEYSEIVPGRVIVLEEIIRLAFAQS